MTGIDDTVARVTPEFYRTEADRLLGLACNTREPRTRIELLEMAARFRQMASYLEGSNDAGAANLNNTDRDQTA